MSASLDPRQTPLHNSISVLIPESVPSARQASHDGPLRAAELLITSVQRLSLATNLNEVLAVVRTAARQLTGADGASVILRSGSDSHYADEDAIGPLWKGQRRPMGQCISGWVMQNHLAVAIPDVYDDIRIPADAYKSTFVHSLAMVPIGVREPLGAIGNYWAREHKPTPFELRLLQALADATAAAIEKTRSLAGLEARVFERTEQLEAINKELRAEAELRRQVEAKVLRLSLTDDLTGLSNRRGFLVRTEQMLKLIHRMNTRAWLFFIDLDGLKQVNDKLGHPAGDIQIQAAARVLRESFRDADILSRIGGDEFLVFAVSAQLNPSEAERRIHDRVSHHNRLNPQNPPLAMSIGVVCCEPDTESLEPLIREADAAMYRDKNRKRDLRHPAR